MADDWRKYKEGSWSELFYSNNPLLKSQKDIGTIIQYRGPTPRLELSVFALWLIRAEIAVDAAWDKSEIDFGWTE